MWIRAVLYCSLSLQCSKHIFACFISPLPLPPSLPPFATPPSHLHRSLGVTLWELCSFASWPYEDMLNEEVVEHVKNKPKCVLENPDEGGPLQDMWACIHTPHTHTHIRTHTHAHTHTHTHTTHTHTHQVHIKLVMCMMFARCAFAGVQVPPNANVLEASRGEASCQ